MQTLVAIDPGVWGYGAAIFGASTLKYAGYVVGAKGTDIFSSARVAANRLISELQAYRPTSLRIVCEVPRIYPAARQKGRPNDLIDLSLSAGAFVSAVFTAFPDALSSAESIFPRSWKGTVDPDLVMFPRIMSRLTPEEFELADGPQSVLHNVVDAIGIGLYMLGRLNPKKVIARE